MAHETDPSDRAGETSPAITAAPFGEIDGKPVSLFTLVNGAGMEARITNYGGILTHLFVPDEKGVRANVVLGHETLAAYRADPFFLGALIGRYGNRIGGAAFTLDGETHELIANNGPNTLHGGPDGFHRRIWRARPLESENGPALELSLISPDGDQGFPGTLAVTVTYWLANDNVLYIDYRATADRATPVALTHHSYFNLTGDPATQITGHRLRIMADAITAVDDTMIPTGERRAVAGTPFDFRDMKPIGEGIDRDDPQLSLPGGYDHNYVLSGEDDPQGTGLALVAQVEEPMSGRVMDVLSDAPGMQFYSGNGLSLAAGGFAPRTGLCLETQSFPDSPNRPDFPSAILQPGEEYSTRTAYRFSSR